VIAVDTNILVYAHRSRAPQHEVALQTVRRLAEGEKPWALPVFVCGEFLRVVTHPSLLSRATLPEVAIMSLDSLVSSPSVVVLHPGERFWGLFASAVLDGAATGNLVFDAQIVALCREHGIDTILSEDRDFGRFTGFRAVPLDRYN
jgi:hypothetical protein